MEINTDCSHIITPPDLLDVQAPAILLIDPTESEIENVAYFLKTAKNVYAVYVFCAAMHDRDWLHNIVEKAAAIVVNTESNIISPYKDKLAAMAGKVYHYGQKKFLMANSHHIESPVDYFINYTSN